MVVSLNITVYTLSYIYILHPVIYIYYSLPCLIYVFTCAGPRNVEMHIGSINVHNRHRNLLQVHYGKSRGGFCERHL